MIVSASRRTDIPAFFTPWFFNRLREGFAWVRNPRFRHTVYRVDLTPELVDGFVFWTKNPKPMLPRLPELDRVFGQAYYFQFTITAYDADLEPRVADKKKVVVPTFRELAGKIGPERVIWRYDPILLNPKYTAGEHVRRFAELASDLDGCTKKCVISFIDRDYAAVRRNHDVLALIDFPPAPWVSLAARLAEIARRHGMAMETCAESVDLSAYGIGKTHCVDAELLGRLCGGFAEKKGKDAAGHVIFAKKPGKDAAQREACGCVTSVDLGYPNTCRHGCRYCYADGERAAPDGGRRDQTSPILGPPVRESDTVRDRVMTRYRVYADARLRLREAQGRGAGEIPFDQK